MIRVNSYWIEDCFDQVGWHVDADDHPLNRLNMENETSQAILVEQFLLPAFGDLSVYQQSLLKQTLKYAVNFFSDHDWRSWTQNSLPNISSEPVAMFRDVWGMLFRGEPWFLNTRDGYSLNNNAGDRLHAEKYRLSAHQ